MAGSLPGVREAREELGRELYRERRLAMKVSWTAAVELVALDPVSTLLEMLEVENTDRVMQADVLTVLEAQNTVERARVEVLVVLGQTVGRMARLEAVVVLGQLVVQMTQVEVQDTV